MTRSLRFHPYFLMASPMTFSDSPSAYPSAQSKKLTPQSYAAFMHSYVPSRSTCPPYVSHPPSEMADTCSPDRPRKRYSISGRLSGLDMVFVFWRV